MRFADACQEHGEYALGLELLINSYGVCPRRIEEMRDKIIEIFRLAGH